MSALSIKELRKTYSNGTEALKGINLDVQEGDFFALLGPNGAGKSTTIGIISSLVNKTAGQVQVFGYDLDKDKAELKASVGLVPQEFNFEVFATCRNTLINQAGYYGISFKVAKQRADHLLQKLNLWQQRDKRINELSGGMKRRLLIARGLIHKPQLLILDEPTAGVDIELRREIWAFLAEINQAGTTIILTTHYLEEAEHLCRNIAIIDDGEVITNTSVNQLLRQLDCETFELNLAEPLSQTPNIPNYQVELIEGVSLRVEVSKEQDLNTLFSVLAKHNIIVSSLRNKTNRLEELFLKLTRHHE